MLNFKRDLEIPEEIIFCTECGSSLTDFYLSSDVKDVEKLEAHYQNCRSTGKFKGEMCSKMFIALDFELEIPEDTDE